MSFGGPESGHPETGPVTEALMGVCGWPGRASGLTGRRACARTAAAEPWSTGAGPRDLPAGGLRGHGALLQGHPGGHDPGAGCRTSPEGEWLLLPVCEGQHGRYTAFAPHPMSPLRLAQLPSHVSVSPWPCQHQLPWPTPVPQVCGGPQDSWGHPLTDWHRMALETVGGSFSSFHIPEPSSRGITAQAYLSSWVFFYQVIRSWSRT